MAYKTDMDESELVAEIREKWKEAKEGLADWRQEARESYAFRDGDQWTQDDINKLNEEGRPPITFNRIGAMVDAVSGLEINSRQSIRYFPREVGDVRVNEILTATAKWIRDETNGEDEDSEAFKDAATCGIGVTETRMDYELDRDGKIVVERRDPLMVFPDPNAQRRSLKDARYVFHAEWIDKKDVTAQWDKEIAWSDDDLGEQTPGDGDKSFLYDGDTEANEFTKDKALVLHYQCCKKETVYRTLDPFTREEKLFTTDEFEKLKKNAEKLGMGFHEANKNGAENSIPYVKQRKNVYYRGFVVGSTLLEYGKSPSQTGFTFKFITGKRDRNKKCWYGVVRVLKDPQRWANKWLSQILHIINSNAKGGAFVEEGALFDKRKAEDQWGTPAPLILLKEGGIGKIKERTPAGYPTGLDRLMMFAFESFPFISGIPLEAMGLANREQAGILEAQRRKAAMAILAPLFESLREYRKDQGELLLEFIQKFIPDGKLVRITGNQGDIQFAPLIKAPDTATFDVIVDQSPDSPDFRERAWEALTELLPPLMKQGVPIPAEALKYAPIPSEVAQVLEQAMSQNKPLPPEVQQQMQMMQQALEKTGQDLQKLTQENFQLKMDNQVEIMKVQAKVRGDMQREATKKYTADLESSTQKAVAMLEGRMESFKTQMEHEARQRETSLKAIADIQKELIKASNKPEMAEKAEREPKMPPVNVYVGGKKKTKASKQKDGTWMVEDVE